MRLLRMFLVASLLSTLPLAAARAADSGAYVRPQSYDHVIRVACVGDSITFGAGVENRDQNHYPLVLGKCLGAKFETRNFGISGATLLQHGDHPYSKMKAFQEAKDYAPDVVVIKLGTNDSKPQNWKFRDEFEADLKGMVEAFRSLPSHPKIWVCLPVPVYQDRWGINEKVVAGEIIPMIRRAAAELKVPTIDLHGALSNRPEWFPDGVHPNALGAANLAQVICYSLVEHP